MSRLSERARNASTLGVVLLSCVVLGGVAGCDELDARNRVRQGNRLFRETQFVDAVAEYERALKVIDDPTIHYNIGLAYQKVVKPGFDGPILLGPQDDVVCRLIPNVKMVQAGACVKPGDRHFAECGAAKTQPIEREIAELQDKAKLETDEAKKKELQALVKDKQDELNHYVCSSSFQCVEGMFCSLTSPEVADMGAQHFQTWINAQPSDEELKDELVAANAELEAAKKADNKSLISTAQKRVDDVSIKDQTRKVMTKLWIDTEQFPKAIDYWMGLLKAKPDDPEIIGILAGIYLQAGDWRKSIEGYNRVADLTADPSSKTVQYNFIGNVAWSKLNSRLLVGTEAIEIADRGIGALQRAITIDPKSGRFASLQASLYNFRSTAHGASFAAAVDRATAQDLSKYARVLIEEAKKAQGQGAPAPGTAPATPGPGTPAPGTAPATPGTPGTPAPTTAPGTTSSSPGTTAPATPPAPGSAAEKSGG